jgi:hypothetical protein
LQQLLDDPDGKTRERAFKTMLAVYPGSFKPPLQIEYYPGSNGRLEIVDCDDGHFELVQQFGRPVIRALGTYLYFRVDDQVAHDISAMCHDSFSLKLSIRDSTVASFDVEYDGHPMDDDNSGGVLRATRLAKTMGSGPRQDFVLDMPQVRMANRLCGGADFRIRAREGLVLELENAVLVRFFAEEVRP